MESTIIHSTESPLICPFVLPAGLHLSSKISQHIKDGLAHLLDIYLVYIYSFQTMNRNEFGDPLTFNPMPS